MSLDISLQVSSRDKTHASISLFINGNRVNEGFITLRNSETVPFIVQLQPSRLEIDGELLSEDLMVRLKHYEQVYVGTTVAYV
jgi:hypothetical protein